MSYAVNREELLDRFIGYAKVNTRSDAKQGDKVPSTECQVTFLKQLAEEMEAIGLVDVQFNPKDAYVTGRLPKNIDDALPVIGFFAHVDTADFNAENISPQIIESYDGGVIPLGDSGYKLDPKEFSSLKKYVGETLITTDGTTLLGADDKSGVAEIMTAMAYLQEHPEIKHGDIKVAFGPDEEIGLGATRFDVEGFGADFAYTIDGGPKGELQYETFNAAFAHLTFHGKNVHPGSAKDLMINALELAIAFDNALPALERPEHTAGREGFYHLLELEGVVDHAESQYIIRDHDKEAFKNRKDTLLNITKKMNRELGQEAVVLDLHDEYYNMGDIISKDMRPLELAKKAFAAVDIEPNIQAVRGGTDGSILTYNGLPTPNIFAGGENMHGRFEYVSLETMVKATEVLLAIVEEAKDYQHLEK